jgi:cytidylate kinase
MNIITVDGPSGVGKGTLALRLARRLGWRLLDSGALYRLLGLAAGRQGVALHDDAALSTLAGALAADFVEGPQDVEIWLAGENVSRALRTEEAGAAASQVAALPGVRAALLGWQRAQAKPPGLVADGRDMGATVFPEAGLKLFLTASPQVRAERRYKQLKEKGLEANIAALCEDITVRDARDAKRAVSPLRPAQDALVLDTSALDADAVMAQAWAEAARCFPALAR